MSNVSCGNPRFQDIFCRNNQLFVIEWKLRRMRRESLLTGRSMSIPMGITEATSVTVLRNALFSFSANSSPTMDLLINSVAAPTSIARSWVPCQTSCQCIESNQAIVYKSMKERNVLLVIYRGCFPELFQWFFNDVVIFMRSVQLLPASFSCCKTSFTFNLQVLNKMTRM